MFNNTSHHEIRLAFYGRTNLHGVDGLLQIARQYRICEDAVLGHTTLVRYFYDLACSVDDLMILAVHGAGGPVHRHGGWDELESQVAEPDRPFDAVVVPEFSRIGRQAGLVQDRTAMLKRHQVTLICAGDGLAEWPPTGAATDRIHQLLMSAAREHDYVVAAGRWRARG